MSSHESIISRRGLLAAGAMAAAATQSWAANRIPIALELYSLRQDAANDLPGTLAAVSKMGYEGIELVGERGGLQNIMPFGFSAKDVRKMCDDIGLKIFSAHHTMRLLTDEALEQTVEFNKTIGSSRVIVAWLDATKVIQPWYDHAKRFNELAGKLAPHGLQLGFHNHAHEMDLIEGKLPLDVLYDNTSRDVVLQFHVSAFPAKGLNIVDYMKRYAGRVTSLHLNDHAAGRRRVLLGDGDINWKELLQTAEQVGRVEVYIIEQESYPEGMTPMETVERCLQNFRKLLA